MCIPPPIDNLFRHIKLLEAHIRLLVEQNKDGRTKAALEDIVQGVISLSEKLREHQKNVGTR
jgi:hypothetical protein